MLQTLPASLLLPVMLSERLRLGVSVKEVLPLAATEGLAQLLALPLGRALKLELPVANSLWLEEEQLVKEALPEPGRGVLLAAPEGEPPLLIEPVTVLLSPGLQLLL